MFFFVDMLKRELMVESLHRTSFSTAYFNLNPILNRVLIELYSLKRCKITQSLNTCLTKTRDTELSVGNYRIASKHVSTNYFLTLFFHTIYDRLILKIFSLIYQSFVSIAKILFDSYYLSIIHAQGNYMYFLFLLFLMIQSVTKKKLLI